MHLQVEHIALGYDQVAVVDELSFSIEAGQVGCLLGASGCGKTTALRAIAGFEPVLSGRILINGREVSRPGKTVPPERRSVGMVFQDHALFPHLTVEANVAFGIRTQARRHQRVGELLDLTGLTGFEKRYPHELSGGQQQRVALARALAPEPAVLLLDEPFSSLDTGLRRQMGQDIRRLLTERGAATLLVTHDQLEAFALADQVGLMHQGQLLQWDSPYQLYHRPADRTVASFTGRGCYLKARRVNDQLEHALGTSPLPDHHDHSDGQSQFDLLIRPDDIRPSTNGRSARVLQRQFQGAQILYLLELSSKERIAALFTSHDNFAVGEMVSIALDADHLVLFNPENTTAGST